MLNLINNEYFIDASTIAYVQCSSTESDVLSNIYVNTYNLLDMSTGTSYEFNSYARIYVNPLINIDTVEFTLKINNANYDFKWVKPVADLGNYNIEYSDATNMNIPENSFMLLRTNPKLTSNIKVVVDENSNLYLDSFKVNAELSKRKYRKVPISYKDYYGRNAASYASTFPNYNYLYDVPDNYHKLFTVVSEYKNQYVDTYRYGVCNNTDKLYTENFASFAPLSIGKVLPDFYLIFKIDGVIDLTESMTDVSIFKKMLKECKLVKSFDMREDSKLGTYIRNIQENSSNDNGSLFVAYNPNQANTYTGISLDKGIVATKYESTYELKYKNQVQANNFYTLGFQRNSLISDHIVNFEFMFNDDDAEMFEINTYFGLYVKINENDKMCYYIDNSIIELDGNTPIGIDFDASVAENKDLLYCFEDQDNCYRINSTLSEFDKLKNYNNRVGENIFNAKVEKILGARDTSLYYISMNIDDTNRIEPGEHFKIINKKSDSSVDIYEIVVSDYEYAKSDDYISNNVINTAHSENNSVEYNFYRITAYLTYRDSQMSFTPIATILRDALNVLIEEYDAPFEVCSYNNKLGIYSYEKLQFERITNLPYNNVDSSIEDNVVRYFNDHYKVDVSILKQTEMTVDNEYYYANNFEAFSDRRAYIVDFKPIYNKNVYQLNIPNLDKYKDYNNMLLMDADELFVIPNLYESDYSFIDPSKNIFIIEDELYLEGKTNFYVPYTWNFGIASIFNIKDFNFTIYDGYSDIAMPGDEKKKVSDINNNIDYDILEKDSSILKNDVPSEAFTSYISEIDSVPLFAQISVIDTSTEERTIYEVDGSKGETTSVVIYWYDHPVELSMNKYLKFKYDRNVTSSHTSFTSPYTCKWVSNGTDVIANNIKLTYNNNLLGFDSSAESECTKSYFFPANIDSSYNTKSNKLFSSLIGFTYVPKISGKQYKKYYSNLFNSNIDSSSSMRDSIYKKNLSISNLIYDKTNFKNKFSKVYYRGNNILEFISSGVKFNIKFNSDVVVNLEKYTTYKGIFLTTTGRNLYNDSDIELFIDEKDKTIALIWHICVNSLRYRNEQGDLMREIPIQYSLGNKVVYSKRTTINTDLKMFYLDANKHVVMPTYSLVDSSLKDDTKVAAIGINIIDNYHNYDRFMVLMSKPEVHNKTDMCRITKVIGTDIGNSGKSKWYSSSSNGYITNTFNSTLNRYLKNAPKTDIVYLLSDSDEIKDVNVVPNYEDLKNMIKSAVVYIKSADGNLKFYNNDTADLFSVSVIDPIEETYIKTNRTSSSSKFYVHPTYFEPEMVDMLEFEYDDASISEKFKKNFLMSNTRVSEMNTIKQLWFNKLSSDLNYCFNCNYTAFGLGIDVKPNCSIVESVWNHKYFNKYSRDSKQDEYDRKNLAGLSNCIVSESISSTDVSLYDYLPKVPNYLISNTLDLADVESNIKLNKEIFNKSSYDSSILYVYKNICHVEDSSIYSNCVESPNFKKMQ